MPKRRLVAIASKSERAASRADSRCDEAHDVGLAAVAVQAGADLQRPEVRVVDRIVEAHATRLVAPLVGPDGGPANARQTRDLVLDERLELARPQSVGRSPRSDDHHGRHVAIDAEVDREHAARGSRCVAMTSRMRARRRPGIVAPSAASSCVRRRGVEVDRDPARRQGHRVAVRVRPPGRRVGSGRTSSRIEAASPEAAGGASSRAWSAALVCALQPTAKRPASARTTTPTGELRVMRRTGCPRRPRCAGSRPYRYARP